MIVKDYMSGGLIIIPIFVCNQVKF